MYIHSVHVYYAIATEHNGLCDYDGTIHVSYVTIYTCVCSVYMDMHVSHSLLNFAKYMYVTSYCVFLFNRS